MKNFPKVSHLIFLCQCQAPQKSQLNARESIRKVMKSHGIIVTKGLGKSGNSCWKKVWEPCIKDFAFLSGSPLRQNISKYAFHTWVHLNRSNS